MGCRVRARGSPGNPQRSLPVFPEPRGCSGLARPCPVGWSPGRGQRPVPVSVPCGPGSAAGTLRELRSRSRSSGRFVMVAAAAGTRRWGLRTALPPRYHPRSSPGAGVEVFAFLPREARGASGQQRAVGAGRSCSSAGRGRAGQRPPGPSAPASPRPRCSSAGSLHPAQDRELRVLDPEPRAWLHPWGCSAGSPPAFWVVLGLSIVVVQGGRILKGGFELLSPEGGGCRSAQVPPLPAGPWLL